MYSSYVYDDDDDDDEYPIPTLNDAVDKEKSPDICDAYPDDSDAARVVARRVVA